MVRPSLNDLTAFVAVATNRSFRRAADELGTAPSTLSHAMRALEERLGVRLLNRTTRSVSPTEAGQRLLERLQPALSTLDDALESVGSFRGSVAGTVRINAAREPASYIVREVLPLMQERFPDVIVDIVTEGRLVDIVAEGFDAGVRFAASVPRDMIAVPLGRPAWFICVASATYLDRFGEPLTPDELRYRRCVGYRLPGGRRYHWEFEQSGQVLTIDPVGPVILDDDGLMVDAALRDLGIAYVTDVSAQTGLKDGRLRQILKDWTPPPEPLALYYPGHRAVQPALRVFIDVLKEVGRKGVSGAG